MFLLNFWEQHSVAVLELCDQFTKSVALFFTTNQSFLGALVHCKTSLTQVDLLGVKFMFAKRDKHYPSRSGQTSLATAVTNFTKPVTKINFGPSCYNHLLVNHKHGLQVCYQLEPLVEKFVLRPVSSGCCLTYSTLQNFIPSTFTFSIEVGDWAALPVAQKMDGWVQVSNSGHAACKISFPLTKRK